MATAPELTTPAHGFTVAYIKGRYYVTVEDARKVLDLSLRQTYNLCDKKDGLETIDWGGIKVELESLKAEAARRGIVIPEMGEVSR